MVLHFMLAFWLLVCGHYVGDWGFQSDIMANAKNMDKKQPIHEFVPWSHWMAAHSMINAALVTATTVLTCFLLHGTCYLGLVLLAGLLEAAFHFGVDCAKCTGLIGIDADQGLHLLGKALLALIILFW